MKKKLIAVVALGLVGGLLGSYTAQAKTLEEVLKEKGVITEVDYNDIMKG